VEQSARSARVLLELSSLRGRLDVSGSEFVKAGSVNRRIAKMSMSLRLRMALAKGNDIVGKDFLGRIEWFEFRIFAIVCLYSAMRSRVAADKSLIWCY
jgi:hypothetical protein